MSYILDALRRADAERERGAVPGLRSQQHPIADDDAAPPRREPLVWAVVALGVALAGALAWNLFGGSGSTVRAPAVEGSVAPPPAPLPAMAAGPAVAPAPVGSAGPSPTYPAQAATTPTPTAPTPMTAPPSLPAATAEPAAPMPPAAMRTKAAAPARPAPEPKRAAATSARESSTAPATAAASGAGGRGAAESRVYAASELPEEIRRDLPKVVIGGSSYSGDAASRMVMINGQVFHEGDRLAPNLVLEKIQRKSAVLAYKGWRYELAF